MIQSLGSLPFLVVALSVVGFANVATAQVSDGVPGRRGTNVFAKRGAFSFGTAQFRMPTKINLGEALNAAEPLPPSLFRPVSTLQIRVVQPQVFADESVPALVTQPETMALLEGELNPPPATMAEPLFVSGLPVTLDNPSVPFAAPDSPSTPFAGPVRRVDPLADPAQLMLSAAVQSESLSAPEVEPEVLPKPANEAETLPAQAVELGVLPAPAVEPGVLPAPAVEANVPPAWQVQPELLPEPTAGPALLPEPEVESELPPVAEDVESITLPGDAELLPGTLEATDPLFDVLVNEGFNEDVEYIVDGPLSTFSRVKEFVCRPAGVGAERVVHAPFEVDTTQPQNYISLGTDFAYDFIWPNRAEYLLASPLKGPGPEDSADYQDFLFKVELGSKSYSLATEIPIRGIDPEINRNHAGLGDVKVTLKTVFLDGRTWQITPMLRTHVNTGNAKLGLGTGHVSLEPGVLFRYRVDDANYIHAALKYWFPIGGDPIHGGEVLSDGFAWSRVLRERDSYAWISSLEAVHWQVMDGQRTTSGGVFDIDPENIFTIYAGGRLVCDTGSDLGLVEYGLQFGTAFGDARWYQNLLRANIRFSF
ncbi:hypothetical protein [Aporhodopirellula aestuarii]|uniref:Uncharacterized protein n=1 Tax=Aporhodopirellula aestuarii TaxID=2950107 RepID=A0ABT0TZ53_9BACT|nr:hypothetical protein [Aporhodopirellula aestuarii]MCM2369883.1 hypothetical protein [Aporhodopirellula aestuarii]